MKLRGLALLWLVAVPARAQIIQIKTIPIAQGDQFQFFPANNLGMGSISIALPDSLNDPFVNPALGTRLNGARFFSSPTLYSVSRKAGGGRSLPLALVTRSAAWFCGLALALQQVDPSRPPRANGGFVVETPARAASPLGPADVIPAPIPRPDTRAHGNEYAFGMIGRDLPAHISIGGSVFWTGLHALDGVDLLYAGSQRVAQDGHVLDLRLGMTKEWREQRGTRSLDALVLHNDFAATHTVTYVDGFWDPATATFGQRARIEHNFDHTHTWGLQLKYAIPLAAPGWRIGWTTTLNASSHPKIPNYELANVPVIPRDPGYSTAFDFGIGASRALGPSTFGVDLAYEPIRSYTWADAASPIATAAGDTIAAGGKTIENHFRFSNLLLRLGVGREIELLDEPEGGATGKILGVQFGLIVRRTHYTLAQSDHVQALQRELTAGWMEYTPTWGLSLRFPELAIRYSGRVTHGAGRPSPDFPIGGWATRDVALAGGTILAAPTGPLSSTKVNTATHQISVSVPLP